MRYLWCIVGLLLMLAPVSTRAEIYKYRDENGVVRYTDNIVEVPKAQQQNIKAYEEIKILESAEEAQGIETMEDVAQRLQQEKEALRKEFEALESERQQLDAESKIARLPEENEMFEKKIIDYNARLQQYEQKRLKFKEKADAYNSVIDAQFK
jgi:chromosome segregation ATPase